MQNQGKNQYSIDKDMQKLEISVSALSALSIMIPDTIDQETTVSSEQIGSLIKCVVMTIESAKRSLAREIG